MLQDGRKTFIVNFFILTSGFPSIVLICLHITLTARGREGNSREKARKKDSSPVSLSQG